MAKKSVKFSMVNPNAAGIDIGSKSHWVCAGKEKEHIREFSVFTHDLHELANWLKSLGIQTIAMESTGVYWKSLFLLLQDYQFEVILVNASHVKNVRGKKTDVQDCQWIWQLHTAGLLAASFQPDIFTESIRTYSRHRKSLIDGAARYVSKMQKAMVVQNIHLSVVLTDITGKSGRAIITKILAGERDGKKLATLADPRVKASKEKITKALTGYWKEEHLFELRQAWDMYNYYYSQVAECDKRIERLLKEEIQREGQNDLLYNSKRKRKQKNDPDFHLPELAYQLTYGIDLTTVDGIGVTLILTIIAEVGIDLSKFPTAKHFVSWLCLCPNKKVSGNRVLSSRSRKNKSRLAYSFRQAANAVGRQKDSTLSYFFRRIAYKHGRKVAITATARKLAIIVYNMLEKKQPYNPIGASKYHELVRENKLKHVQRAIQKHNIKSDELAFM